MLEQPFKQHLLLALGARSDMRVHSQNVGSVRIIRNNETISRFHAGPPPGASDISGIVLPGFRIEIETKGAKTKTGVAQHAWSAMITKFGGIYVRVRYDESQSMDENITRAVNEIESAISRRRAIHMNIIQDKKTASRIAPHSPVTSLVPSASKQKRTAR